MTRTFGYDEFPIMMEHILDDRVQILICCKCGYPVGSCKDKGGSTRWHCYHCQKFRSDVKWVKTKEARS